MLSQQAIWNKLKRLFMVWDATTMVQQVTGDPRADEMSFTNTDDRTIVVTAKKAGRVTLTAQVVASGNGRTFAMSTNGTSYRGKRVNNRAVYDVR